MKLASQLNDYVNAAFTGLWIHTAEPDEAEREILQHARQKGWRLAIWDLADGLRLGNGNLAMDASAPDPVSVLKALPALADKEGSTLLILHNFHRLLNNPEVIQTTYGQLIAGKQQRTFLVVLSPVVQIPVELEKLFVVVEHALPEREQLLAMARELVSDRPQDLPGGTDLDRLLDAAAGLTRVEAEGAMALSLTRYNAFRPDAIWEMKANTLKKNNLLTLHRGAERFDSLGGLTNLKDFCKRALEPGKKVKPRGILLLGVPGTGKSVFCKALGNETGRPTLLLDIGALMGSLVGQSEGNVRQALKIADAMSPCILFVDELDKALSGVGGSGDSGVSTRLFGTLLSWLSDHTSDVFFVGTSNDVSKLPPEFARAERFDACYFLDLPTSQEKDAIWKLYRQIFEIPIVQAQPDDTDWTGAEIKSCCRLAALLDVPLTQASHNVVPVARTAAEQMDKLRTWASGRCLAASSPGIYERGGSPQNVRRRVQREPESN